MRSSSGTVGPWATWFRNIRVTLSNVISSEMVICIKWKPGITFFANFFLWQEYCCCAIIILFVFCRFIETTIGASSSKSLTNFTSNAIISTNTVEYSLETGRTSANYFTKVFNFTDFPFTDTSTTTFSTTSTRTTTTLPSTSYSTTSSTITSTTSANVSSNTTSSDITTLSTTDITCTTPQLKDSNVTTAIREYFYTHFFNETSLKTDTKNNLNYLYGLICLLFFPCFYLFYKLRRKRITTSTDWDYNFISPSSLGEFFSAFSESSNNTVDNMEMDDNLEPKTNNTIDKEFYV